MQKNTINGFTLLRPLGSGGMAEVWYAENRIKKPAAIKILLKEFVNMQGVVQRFENEALLMVRLGHPNIRQVWDYGLIDGRPAIIMEYLEGADLAIELKRKERLSDKQVRLWWNQIADALNYTHEQDIIHRDIKPSNIFITKAGQAKLLDFGIAKVKASISQTLTQTGTQMGTPIYMSPEQVKDSKHLDYKTDMYSLAVTFVHLLSGSAPYDVHKDSNFGIQLKIVSEPVDVSYLKIDWGSLLKAYLEKDPSNRPTTISTLERTIRVEENRDTILQLPKSDFIENESSLQFDMVYVKGGSFLMGATPEQQENAFDFEKPVRSVEAKDFFISKFPVTVSQFSRFIKDTGYRTDADNEGDSHIHILAEGLREKNINWQYDEKGVLRPADEYDFPVLHVSWNDAIAFCKWLSGISNKHYRLPTEAEWEFAARGGIKSKAYIYSGSNSIDDSGWYWDNAGMKLHRSGEKLPNELGIYDMSGNLWEWCEDNWHDDYLSAPDVSTAWYNNQRRLIHILRGGSWADSARYCRVSCRDSLSNYRRSYRIGFRICCQDR